MDFGGKRDEKEEEGEREEEGEEGRKGGGVSGGGRGEEVGEVGEEGGEEVCWERRREVAVEGRGGRAGGKTPEEGRERGGTFLFFCSKETGERAGGGGERAGEEREEARLGDKGED